MTLTQIKPAGLSKPVDLADNEKIRLGTGNDLQIYHDGSNSFLDDSGTGNLVVRSSTIAFENAPGGGESLAKFIGNGAVELYHDNSKKLETTGGGVTVTGTLSCSSNLTASGASNVLGNTTINGGGGAGGVALTVDYSGTDVFKVSNLGKITITGDLDMQDSDKILLGTGDDLQIYHDGSNGNSHINESGSGSLVIKATNTYINNSADEQMIAAIADGAVELYHDNSKKFETTSGGATLTGNFLPEANNTRNLGSDTLGWNSIWASTRFRGNDNVKLVLGDAQDLQIYHNGTNNYFESTNGVIHLRGNYGIQFDTTGSGNTWLKCLTTNNQLNSTSSSVELYYNNSKKIETYTDGVKVTGVVRGTTSGFGIDFAQTDNASGMSSEVLDDYEEGTYTPVITADSGSVVSYHNTEGAYTKIGRYVKCIMRIRVNNSGSLGGNIRVSLPFTVANVMTSTGLDGSGQADYWSSQNTAIVHLSAVPASDSSTAFLYIATGATATISNLTTSNAFGDGWDVRLHAEFFSS